KREHPAGSLIFWYMVLAGAARFIVEFVRINPRVFYGLSEAQLIAFGMVVVGALALAVSAKRKPSVTDSPEKSAPIARKDAIRA
ncbi:MAG TPA: prolipoprotein diacylglyceryl transferase family protein, partial [Sporolactobacillaceae bacterium]|nr:prolipoprotein diacylglyceryl transferase family protein [Sporolactobacillaceae bacterium]